MTTDTALMCVDYITTAPFFWGSMGFTTAVGMFIGAVIYDGNLPDVKKGIVSILSYACMLFWIISSRVFNGISTALQPERALASLLTIMIVTVFWVFGVYLGVWVLNLRKIK